MLIKEKHLLRNNINRVLSNSLSKFAILKMFFWLVSMSYLNVTTRGNRLKFYIKELPR